MARFPSDSLLSLSERGPAPDNFCVMNRVHKKQGTTLIELMCCLVFLSLAVYPMLACISGSQVRSQRAEDRMIALGLVQDQIEKQRGIALTLALTTGTTTTTTTPTSMTTPVTVTTTISLVAGYTDLYLVSVSASWGTAVTPWRVGTLSLATYMRAPHV